MDRDPEVIKQEIEDTRSRMGDTVEALAYKTDVSARTRDAVNDRVDAIKGRVSGAMSAATSAVGNAMDSTKGSIAGAAASARSSLDAMPSAGEAGERFTQFRSAVMDNPLALAVGSLAIGFLVGLMVPVTQIERERVGPLGEQLTDTARSAASDAIEQGKSAVTQAIGDAIGGAASKGSSATGGSGGETAPLV